MEKNCTSLLKLRKKIQTKGSQEEGLCVGCMFLNERSCDLPASSFYDDKRFDCSVYNSMTGYVTYFIFVKEEK